MADTERKIQTVRNQSDKKVLSMKCFRENMLLSGKKNHPSFKFRIGDAEMKQIQEYQYLENVLTEDGKCHTEIRRFIGISKNALQKFNRVLRNRKKRVAKNNEKSNELLRDICLPIWQ